MATKYIAIPESMYKALIQSQNFTQIGTELAKSDLEKIQNLGIKIYPKKMFYITKS